MNNMDVYIVWPVSTENSGLWITFYPTMQLHKLTPHLVHLSYIKNDFTIIFILIETMNTSMKMYKQVKSFQ